MQKNFNFKSNRYVVSTSLYDFQKVILKHTDDCSEWILIQSNVIEMMWLRNLVALLVLVAYPSNGTDETNGRRSTVPSTHCPLTYEFFLCAEYNVRSLWTRLSVFLVDEMGKHGFIRLRLRSMWISNLNQWNFVNCFLMLIFRSTLIIQMAKNQHNQPSNQIQSPTDPPARLSIFNCNRSMAKPRNLSEQSVGKRHVIAAIQAF